MSFPTHNWATGITEEITRKKIVARVRLGPVSQTIRNKGGTFRSARRRSRHVTGASADFGNGGWGGIKYQCSAAFRGFYSERGPRAPFDTICLNLKQAPCNCKGDVWENQVRRKRNRQNLFVIQMIGPRRLRVK